MQSCLISSNRVYNCLCHCGILLLFYVLFALHCVHSSFAIVLMGKRDRVGCFAYFVFLVSLDLGVALPRGTKGLSAVCVCGVS